jgi:hypothetical protein
MKPTPYLNTYCLTPARRYADTPTRPFIWLQTLARDFDEFSRVAQSSATQRSSEPLPERLYSAKISRAL